MAPLTTQLYTWVFGKFVGEDAQGNKYYVRSMGNRTKEKRWVIYKGESEASKVPASWHGWLHYTVNDAPVPRQAALWEKPHRPNLTGTPDAQFPASSARSLGQRSAARGDYTPWRPEQS